MPAAFKAASFAGRREPPAIVAASTAEVAFDSLCIATEGHPEAAG
jgi:hypothetical protein